MKNVIIISKPEDTIKVQSNLITLIPELEKGKVFDCTIEPHRVKRSKNANDYSWVLQNEIAKVLNRKISDIHNEMVLQYGVIETYSIKKEAFDSARRIFDYFEELGESEVKGTTFIHVKAGIGTHLYNSLEMAEFIDGVVQEAKDLGIDTKTPNEIREMKALWDKGIR